MSEDTTHIGSRRLKRKQSKRLPLVLLAIAATGLIALAAIAAAYQFGGDVAEPEAAPSPTIQLVDERGSCQLMLKTGGEVADMIVEFAAHPDGSTTDWPKMQQAADNLKTIRSISQPDQHPDIDAHIVPVEQLLEVHRTGANRSIDFEGLRAAGLRMATRCMKYAS